MNNTGKKFGGRQKGTPNKITSEIRDKISILIKGTVDSIDVSTLTHFEKVKLLNALVQYVVPKLQSADYQIGTPEGQGAVTIQFVDSSGKDISDQKQDEIKHLQTLDENDLGLAQDLNKIFNE
jgi:hypothetical protein